MYIYKKELPEVKKNLNNFLISTVFRVADCSFCILFLTLHLGLFRLTILCARKSCLFTFPSFLTRLG